VTAPRDIKKQGNLYRAEILIPNKKGLHARASAQFVRTASKFKSEVRVTRDGNTVGGTSIMGLMMLGAGQGQIITMESEGADAREALNALMELIEDKFGEDE
jgi:phosphocarrier protein HPr